MGRRLRRLEVDALTDELVSAIDTDDRYIRVLGGGGTGKSLVVAKRIERLITDGCDPARILAVVTNRNALRTLEDRLTAAGTDWSGLALATPQELCVRLLGTPQAMVATGRIPRLLNSIEELFLLEDLKCVGLKPSKIREMVRFFYREWTELGDDAPDFIRDSHESDLYTALTMHLLLRQAMSVNELSNVTYRYLTQDEHTLSAAEYEHVLVDDFQNLNRASQLVVTALAARSLTVTGDVFEVRASNEPYPYPKGLLNLIEDHPDTVTVTLTRSLRCPQRVAAAGNALLMAAEAEVDREHLPVTFDQQTPIGKVTVVKWQNPNTESKELAAALKRWLSNSQGALLPQDILVIVPNRVWGRRISRSLDDEALVHEDLFADIPIGGNPQRLEVSSGMRSYTALALTAQPDDIVAWRSWCGFGDYLTNSNAWSHLLKYANEQGIDPIKALERAAVGTDDLFLQAGVLGFAYRSGRALIERCADLTGSSLVAGIHQGDDASFEDLLRLLGSVESGETASQLYDRARRRMSDPWSLTDDRVRIATLNSASGIEAKLVVFAGMVDGFLPSSATFGLLGAPRTQQRQRERERHSLYSILSQSSEQLVFSYFRKCDIDLAESLAMEVRSIRVEHGERVAMLTVSRFIEDMGEAVPEAVGEL
jgi:DNA helicase-2/ATP-dependent DNA helicase PcrA